MKLTSLLSKFLPQIEAFAHCDIPCGIYDPTPMQIAAHTVIRMTSLLIDREKEEDTVLREHHVARIAHVKEEHGHAVEHEIGTLKNDYFKKEHKDAYPELKGLMQDAIALSVKTRQGIDMDAAKELLEKVLQISEIFYKSKNVTPVRVKSLYPTEGEIVTYKA